MDNNKNILNSQEENLKNLIDRGFTLSDEDLDTIVTSASESTPEEVYKMRDSISNADSIDIDEDGFSEEIKSISLNSSYSELMTGDMPQLPETSADIFKVNEKGITISEEDIENRMKDNASQMFDMSDEESLKFISLIKRYKNKEVPNPYAELPSNIKNTIANMAATQGIPFTEYNKMARLFLDEFINEAEIDEAFVDFERSLNEALKIPSISDMYSEHTKMTMDVKIPELIEKIKDEAPDKAKLLEDIRTQFYDAYSLKRLAEHYNENTRTRKLIRRDYEDAIKFCDEFNLKNRLSKFKMPDCTSIGLGLIRVFIKEIENLPEEITFEDLDLVQKRIVNLNITMKDINKFAVLFCRHIILYDPDNILDAAYMYYALRNITSLNLTTETKTEFAAELIINICDIIEMIRNKEAEFNASNQSVKKRKSSKNVR